MIFKIEDKIYNVIINKKNIKNLYIRLDNECNIIVNCNKKTKLEDIKSILEKNHKFILKSSTRINNSKNTDEYYNYLGVKYKIEHSKTNFIDITNHIIFINNINNLDKSIKNEAYKYFYNRLEILYSNFSNIFIFPSLKIRKMKTRWGVCNVNDKTITLNFDLIGKSPEIIDYVIIHELCHFIHQNHGTDFWKTVSVYCENYKELRKKLKQ